MDSIKILWADDEIDLLKPQLKFLESKGYTLVPVSNGRDALDQITEDKSIDIVFLDESMPGMTGLEVLPEIKKMRSNIPVVMITKNEEEDVMEEAIGSQISDYLIKPVHPNQILLTLKKLIDNKRLVREKTSTDYQQEFRQILMEINSHLNYDEWMDIYKRIINWELRLSATQSDQMSDILVMQKSEANNAFSKFIDRNYLGWMKANDGPVMSHNLLQNKLLPLLDEKPTYFFLLDNLRYDQWMILEPIISDLYTKTTEDYFYSILPTSTQYSRNAIFAGMTPLEISKHHKDKWLNDNEKGGKNMQEKAFLTAQLNRLVHKEVKHSYQKITNLNAAKRMYDGIMDLMHNDLNVIVYNFIDMLSHARTEMEVIKELAGDENAYRSLTRSWFVHSPLWQAIQDLSQKDVRLIITTDHGTIRVGTPSKVIGDRETTTNLRYKLGRNLKYDKKDVLEITDPEKAGLPKVNVSSTYIFAKEDRYFLYPNNYNHYNNYYKDTFQHGGISLEEIICPYIVLEPKR